MTSLHVPLLRQTLTDTINENGNLFHLRTQTHGIIMFIIAKRERPVHLIKQQEEFLLCTTGPVSSNIRSQIFSSSVLEP